MRYYSCTTVHSYYRALYRQSSSSSGVMLSFFWAVARTGFGDRKNRSHAKPALEQARTLLSLAGVVGNDACLPRFIVMEKQSHRVNLQRKSLSRHINLFLSSKHASLALLLLNGLLRFISSFFFFSLPLHSTSFSLLLPKHFFLPSPESILWERKNRQQQTKYIQTRRGGKSWIL
jgi:hypothetical protein